MNNEILSEKRISWIDTTKGFLLLCVIAGHSIPNPKLHCIIYAFHIPLFILLSGYTHKTPKNFKQCILTFYKTFKKLYAPILITLLAQVFIAGFKFHNFSILSILKSIFYCRGVIWFFCAIFWAKFFYNILLLNCSKIWGQFTKSLIPPPFICVIFLFGLLIIKKLQSINYIIQIQNLDLIPIFICLLYIGQNFHLYTQSLKNNNKTILCFISFIIWSFNYNKFQLDFGLRIFNGRIYCFIIPVCAIYFIINFCIEIDKIFIIRKMFSFLGQKTVPILCIHHLDKFFIPKIENHTLYFLIRISFILCIFFAVYFLGSKIKNKE